VASVAAADCAALALDVASVAAVVTAEAMSVATCVELAFVAKAVVIVVV
jgi:hypothetical protein